MDKWREPLHCKPSDIRETLLSLSWASSCHTRLWVGSIDQLYSGSARIQVPLVCRTVHSADNGLQAHRANGVPIRALFVHIINENNSLGNPVSVLYKMFRNTSQQWAANPVLWNRTYFLQGFGVNNIARILSDLYFLVQNYHSLYLTYIVCHLTDLSAWRQGAQRSMLLQFAVSLGLRVLIYCSLMQLILYSAVLCSLKMW